MDSKPLTYLIDLSLSKGAQEVEVFMKRSRDLTVEVRDRAVETLESSITACYALRLVKNRCLGFSYCTSANEFAQMAENAIASAMFTEPDESLGFPDPSDSLPVAVFDQTIPELADQEAIDLVLSVEDAALQEDKRIKKVRKVSGSFSTNEIAIASSRGILHSYTATACTAQTTVVAEENGDSQMGWDYEGNRFMHRVSFKDIGRRAAQRALRLLGARKAISVKGSVILHNSTAVDFLGMLTPSFSADSVYKGKSMLKGKMDNLAVSPIINIVDNGLLDGRLGSRPVDGEGVATQGKMLIESGILRGFLHNTYTARRDGVSSTGNAARWNCISTPSVGPTNLCIEPVSKDRTLPLNELIGLIDKGLLVTDTMGMHTANPISGEFSVGVSGLWIEHGTICYPVREAVISGNLLQLFKNVVMLGDDIRFYGNIGAPSLMMETVDISA